MAHDFRCPERRQTFLLPPDVRDWLPEDNIVHLILDAVALMDLAAFEAAHKLGGCGFHHDSASPGSPVRIHVSAPCRQPPAADDAAPKLDFGQF